jgi:hypothetical protein
MRKVWIISLSVFASSLFTVSSPLVAQASVNDKEWNEYYDVTNVTCNHASVEIMRQNTPFINTADTYADSSAWVMVTNNSGLQQYAQTGFIDIPSHGVYYFFEENDATTDAFVLTNGNRYDLNTGFNNYNANFSNAVGPSTVYHTYKVDFNPSSIEWTGNVDGAFSNYFYAYPGTNWAHNEVDYSEEVHNDSSAKFFGSPSLHTLFYDPTWTDSIGNVNNASLTEYNNQPTLSGYSSVTNAGTSRAEFELWDTRP